MTNQKSNPEAARTARLKSARFKFDRRKYTAISFTPRELYLIHRVILNPGTTKLTPKDSAQLEGMAIRVERVLRNWDKVYKLIGLTKEEVLQKKHR